DLIGQRAIETRCQVELRDSDPVVAIERLKQFHRRPDQLIQQIEGRDSDFQRAVDDGPARSAVAIEQRLQLRTREIIVDRLCGNAHWTTLHCDVAVASNRDSLRQCDGSEASVPVIGAPHVKLDNLRRIWYRSSFKNSLSIFTAGSQHRT